MIVLQGAADQLQKRFVDVDSLLRFALALERDNEKKPSIELKIIKGLFFVHLYSAIESIINVLISAVFEHIKNEVSAIHDLQSRLIFMAVFPLVKSIRECKPSRIECNVLQIIDKLDKGKIEFLGLPYKIENVWGRTIDELYSTFGAKINISKEHKIKLDQIVEKRNAIAHGSDLASDVGQRFTCEELSKVRNDAYEILDCIITGFDDYCSCDLFKRSVAPIAVS